MSNVTQQSEADGQPSDQIAQWLAAIVESSDDAIISKDLTVHHGWNMERSASLAMELKNHRKPVTILIPAERVDEEPEILARIRAASGSTTMRP